MKRFTDWFVSEESGQGVIEYGLIIALIIVLVIGALSVLNTKVNGLFTEIGGSFGE